MSFVVDMAVKIGSVRPVKTRRAQDRMVRTGQERDQNGCKRDRVTMGGWSLRHLENHGTPPACFRKLTNGNSSRTLLV